MTSRRRFIGMSAAAAVGMGSGLVPGLAHAGEDSSRAGAAGGASRSPGGPSRPLRILLLGGTGFIGPHLVRTILERGHTPTLFNRGRSRPSLFPELFPDLENLIGDRDGDLSALRGRRWDAVIDDSGYTPVQVRATAQLLGDAVGQYLFTSTRAVYTDYTPVRMDEDAPVGLRGLPEARWEGYGPLKALGEREVQAVFPGASTIVRPAIITGPGDSTDRFTYWYDRVDRGGEVLVPGEPTDPLQYVDVRDLADFYVHLLEQGTTGVFNLEGPAAPLSSAEFVYGLRALTAAPIDFAWVDWEFLERRGLRGGQELPGWRAPVGEWRNYGRMDNRRAIAAGLTFRPLADTARDTLGWWRSRSGEARAPLRAGISPEQEREALAAWRARRG